MAQWHLSVEMVSWINHLSQVLHRRSAWRLLPLVSGMLFAQGRRTVASWLRAGGLGSNPTPGPADQKFLYGHLWVTLAWIVRHPRWGTIGLPLRALLYVRQKDSRVLMRWYKVPFRTKLQQAATLLAWAATWLRRLRRPRWGVVDA